MKKMFQPRFLVLVLLVCCLVTSGQVYEEIESNNTFATANLINSNPSITPSGRVGDTDSIDYFRMNVGTNPLRFTGKVTVYIQAENISAASRWLNLEVFNSLGQNGLISSQRVGGPGDVAPGQIVDGVVELCGQALDSFYLALTTNGDFTYTIFWYENSIENTEPNNTAATATLLPVRTKFTSSIKYTALSNPNYDSVDYFKGTAPASAFSKLFLRIQGTNNSCFNGKSVQYEVFKNNSVSSFASGYVGSNSSVNADETVSTSILLDNFVPGDFFYVKITSNAAFEYSVVFWDEDVDSDPEPNEELSQALLLPQSVEKKGKLGYPRFDDDYYVYDELDKYKLVLPYAGTMKFYIKAVNDSCPGPNHRNFIDYYLYNKNQSKSIYLGGFYYNSPTICGDTRYDTITTQGLAGDTMVLFLWGDQPLSYTIKYEMMDAAKVDAEPNATEATAIPINAGQTKEGNTGFFGAPPYDTEDYYKATLSQPANIKVYVKATYKGTNITNNTNNRLRLLVSGSATTYSLPASPPTQLIQNTTYLDTFRICGLPASNVYFRVQSSSGAGNSVTLRPYEYEIRYELEPAIDTSMDFEPNNTFATAIPVATGKKIEGLIGRTINGQTDGLDYHRIFVTGPDTLRIKFGGTNSSCLDNKYLRIFGYNGKRQLVFFKGWILNAVGTVDAGQAVQDSLKYFVPAGDTIFIQMNADGIFNYHFTTNLQVPSPVFAVVGDSTVCEAPVYTYRATSVVDSNVTYHWSLPLGGGTLTANDSIASIVWNQSGNRQVDLYLSNARGNSITRQRTVIVNGTLPTAVPVITNSSRTLRTSSLPPGATCQWFKNGAEIPGATDSIYYAADAGSFTVSFVNDCGPGALSNNIVFNNPAQAQTIDMPETGTVAMAPDLKLPLNATASSGMRVFYQKISGPFTLANDTILVTGVGSIIVKAFQPGDDVYSAAADKFDTITIVKGSQFITFDSIPDKIYSSVSFTLGATSSVGLSVSYTVPTGNATISAGKLTTKGAGLTTVRASQGGSSNYNAATPVDRSFCVG